MTIPRLAIVVIVGLLIIDFKFADGRLTRILLDDAMQFGSWLNREFDELARRISPFFR